MLQVGKNKKKYHAEIGLQDRHFVKVGFRGGRDSSCCAFFLGGRGPKKIRLGK